MSIREAIMWAIGVTAVTAGLAIYAAMLPRPAVAVTPGSTSMMVQH